MARWNATKKRAIPLSVTPVHLAFWLVQGIRAEYMLCVGGDCWAQSPSCEILVLCDSMQYLKGPMHCVDETSFYMLFVCHHLQ